MYLSKKLLAGIIATAAIAAGTTAFAAIPDGGGVVHGCYNKDTGQLRVTDPATNSPKGCSSKETALDWNQQGPPGPQGESGLSEATVVVRPDPKPISINTPVAGLTASGPRLVTAKIVVGNTQHEFSIATCRLFDGPNQIDESTASTYGPVSGGLATIFLTGATKSVYSSKVVECTDPDGFVRDVKLTATRIDNLGIF